MPRSDMFLLMSLQTASPVHGSEVVPPRTFAGLRDSPAGFLLPLFLG